MPRHGATARVDEVRRRVRRSLARTALAKPAVLVALPFPLLVAIAAALIAGDVPRVALTGGALACFWSAGALAFQGILEETRFRLGERLFPSAFPFKTVAALPAALGSGLAATAGGHHVAGAVLFATLAVVGHLLFFGLDPRRRKVVVAPVAGVDAADLREQLQRAYDRLRAIDCAGRESGVPELGERFARLAQIGGAVVGEIERNPAVAPGARRFLNVYLESAERVTVEYVRTRVRGSAREPDERFRRLLVDMEATFAAQHTRLLERQRLLLDAEIEVLNARLGQEGPG